jgi:Tol biopolymer transport system component
VEGMSLPPVIPLQHFFDNPERAGAKLSPDGLRLSYLAPRDGVLNIWLRSRAGGDDRPLTNDRDRGIRSYFWSRDGRVILYVQDQGGNENYRVYAVDVSADRPPRDLTPFADTRASIIAAPRATPRELLVSLNLRDRQLFDVYRLTIATGRLRPVAENPGNIIGWLADREGRVRAARAQTPGGDF